MGKHRGLFFFFSFSVWYPTKSLFIWFHTLVKRHIIFAVESSLHRFLNSSKNLQILYLIHIFLLRFFMTKARIWDKELKSMTCEVSNAVETEFIQFPFKIKPVMMIFSWHQLFIWKYNIPVNLIIGLMFSF